MSETLTLTSESTPDQVQGIGATAYKTKCAGCNSLLVRQLPIVHCPKCHHVWKARGLNNPVRCVQCQYAIGMWRKQQGIPDRANGPALLSA